MRRQRGFTLLEMIVATVIMATAVVGLLASISGAARNAARLRDYDRVVQLGRLQMNDILADPGAPLSGTFDAELTGGIQAGWDAQIEPFEEPPAPAPGALALDHVRLEIWWMAGDRRRTFTLEALRRRVLRP
ncbi:MAG: type II secretion system protein [Bryobacteraceae bacterium]